MFWVLLQNLFFFFFKWVLWQVQGIVSKRSIPTPLKLSHMLERLLVLLSASYSGGSPFQRKMGGGVQEKKAMFCLEEAPRQGTPIFPSLPQTALLSSHFIPKQGDPPLKGRSLPVRLLLPRAWTMVMPPMGFSVKLQERCGGQLQRYKQSTGLNHRAQRQESPSLLVLWNL